MTRGRRPGDPRLIDGCEGSDAAKARGKLLLEQMLELRTVEETSEALGVCASRVHKLRKAALQGFIDALEPRKTGRPSSKAQADVEAAAEIARLQRELEAKERELVGERVRAELRIQEARKPGKRR